MHLMTFFEIIRAEVVVVGEMSEQYYKAMREQSAARNEQTTMCVSERLQMFSF